MMGYLLAHHETGQITCYKPGQITCSQHGSNLTCSNERPDLVIIGGISQREDLDAIRDVVRKAGCDADILLKTGVFGRVDPRDDKQWRYEIEPDGRDYRTRLRQLAAELKVEFLDMHGPWGQYIRESGKELT